ncbi:helix-turn-helix domain-containing protein [Halalkalibacter sp. APA_J-10(15)]|uniref:helix-turn-helix domain-containing protein n=1 Tax=unclassified Halalkalibacter TaxID=2893063 RepID=UPI001FF26DDF|nr:helix-turn-helix transcriptional regulator [Halalkalibacter sp. APA_J-10(15)]MCK0473655.1 helix-turn-helix domain-containing protein [Halalkalibacter sp. APA_J-10(15)]
MEYFGRRIRAFRKLKGYTQQRFAKEVGLSLSVLGEIERESRQPTEEQLERIAATLNVLIDEVKGT